jgi:hypothetical protein
MFYAMQIVTIDTPTMMVYEFLSLGLELVWDGL